MIKIFRLISGQPVVATLIEETDTEFIVSNPSVPMFQAPNQLQFVPLPQFAKDLKGLMDRFVLKKQFVLFSDDVEDQISSYFEEFVKKFRAKMSGIDIATPEQMNKVNNSKIITDIKRVK